MIQNAYTIFFSALLLFTLFFVPDNTILKGINSIALLIFIFIPQSFWDKVDGPKEIDDENDI